MKAPSLLVCIKLFVFLIVCEKRMTCNGKMRQNNPIFSSVLPFVNVLDIRVIGSGIFAKLKHRRDVRSRVSTKLCKDSACGFAAEM